MATIVTEAIAGLTKEHLSYIRRADDVYAIHTDGQNFLGCVKRGVVGDMFSEDKRVLIPVAGNGADGYYSTAWSFPWQTHPLREGDAISFYWYPDAGTNDYMRDHGLHGDKLYVDISRGEGNKRRSWRYLVDCSTCPDNSARMCRGT